MESKVCGKCKINKCYDAYGRDKSKRLGIQSYCKECNREWKKINKNKQMNYNLKIRNKTLNERLVRQLKSKINIIKKRKDVMIVKLFKIILKIKTIQIKVSSKHCGGCGQWLLKEMFNSDINNSDGLSRRCSICRRPLYIIRRGIKKNRIETITNLECWSIYRTFDFKCFRCGSKDLLTIDHHINNNILSLSNGVILCKRCNTLKHSKDPKDFYNEEELSSLSSLLINHSTYS